MSRVSHRSVGRPFGGVGTPPLLTAVLMLFIVGLVYKATRDPRNWRWLERQPEAPMLRAEVHGRGQPQWKETRITAPQDGDPQELAAGRMQLDAVIDRAPLQALEMPAYWRLLKWARSQTFDELESRSRRDIVYTQLFQRPGKYRAGLLRLRLHVRRIVRHEDLPKNSAEATQVFEVWGFTDESKSHPYAVVVPEIPDWFRVGGEVEEECVCVGYFIKLMAYEAAEKKRNAPLLLGRLRPVSTPAAPQQVPAADTTAVEFGIAALVLVLVVFGVWRGISSRRRNRAAPGPTTADEDVIDTWLQSSPEANDPTASSSLLHSYDQLQELSTENTTRQMTALPRATSGGEQAPAVARRAASESPLPSCEPPIASDRQATG